MTPAERIYRFLTDAFYRSNATANDALAALIEMERENDILLPLLERGSRYLDKLPGEAHDEACKRVAAERDALRLRVSQAEHAVEVAKKECEALRAKTESSATFKLWLEGQDYLSPPVEFTVFGPSKDIGRLVARQSYADQVEAERDTQKAMIARAIGAPENLQIGDLLARLHGLIAERDALRAKLAEYESAPTVAYAVHISRGSPGLVPYKCVSAVSEEVIPAHNTELIARPTRKEPT